MIEEIMAAEPVEANEHLFPLHPVPGWAHEIIKLMSEEHCQMMKPKPGEYKGGPRGTPSSIRSYTKGVKLRCCSDA